MTSHRSIVDDLVDDDDTLTSDRLRRIAERLDATALQPHTHIRHPQGFYCLDCGAPC